MFAAIDLTRPPRAAHVPPILASWSDAERRRFATQTPAEAKALARRMNAETAARRAEPAKPTPVFAKRGAEPAKKASRPTRAKIAASAAYNRRAAAALARRVRNDEADDDTFLELMHEMMESGEITREEAERLCEAAGVDPARLDEPQARIASSKRGAVIDTTDIYRKRNTPRSLQTDTRLTRSPDKSAREIAGQVGVSSDYASAVRQQVQSRLHLPDHVTGKDGKASVRRGRPLDGTAANPGLIASSRRGAR